MVVDNFNVRGTNCPTRPLETDAPLHVDPDAELTGAIALESFKPIAAERSYVFEAGSRIKDFEPPIGLVRKPLEFPDVSTSRECSSPIIPIALDHAEP
jgi:hypothetical protein